MMNVRPFKKLALGCAVTGCAVALCFGGFAHRDNVSPPPDAIESQDPLWLQDLNPALAMAKAQQKDVLLEFSAPQDSAGSAGALESDVLDRASFRREVGRSFVLARMASSSDLSPARITQVTTCAERLGVAHFPTFVLLDPDGRPYAKSELVASDAIAYQEEFSRLRGLHARRDEAIALAQAAKGIDRAKHLDDALAAVGPFAESEYADLRREVIDLDPENAAGLKAKYEPAILARQIDATIQGEIYPLADRGEYSAAIARIDRLMNEIKHTPAQLQLMMAFKGQLFYSLGDKRKAAELIDQAISIDPASESAGRARAAKLQMSGGQ
jgi:tetratricopeptide (TPR) repeat protein